MLTRHIKTDQGPVEYFEVGEGQPLIYFHGTGVTGDTMIGVESQLIDDGFRLIIPNRPGYGATPLAPHDSAVGCGRLTAAFKTEAGGRFSEVQDDPKSLSLCRTTLDAMAFGTRCQGFENDLLVFTREDLFEPGDSIESPTLLLHDVLDPLVPLDHVEWFVSKVPDCRRISLHTAGHLVWSGPEADLMHETRVRFLRENALERT